MNERFELAFADILAANKNGEVRNLLITDNDAEFLDDALYALRSWAIKNGINLVELDERDDSWLPEIQSRELFDKLNLPNTVLLIKNYATVSYMRGNDNTPRNFLRDAVMNRHYGCGNDFEPSDELPNLMFVVALNDLSEMYWREDEYSLFEVVHEDNNKVLWVNTKSSHPASNMHPVLSAVNKIKCSISEDGKTLRIDVGDAFGRNGIRLRRPIRYYSAEDRTNIIHSYIEKNLSDFRDQIECFILKMGRFTEEEHFVIDADRLRKHFPNIKSIYCTNIFEINNSGPHIDVFDPFELGEYIFNIAQTGDFQTANYLTRRLWAFDHKWAKFYREVARDFCRRPEDHAKSQSDECLHHWTGMDHLFHIYLLGWWHSGDDFFDEEDKVYVMHHKNFDKAISLLTVRFQNCDIQEINEKLYWDLQHIKHDENTEQDVFDKILAKVELLFPGVEISDDRM